MRVLAPSYKRATSVLTHHILPGTTYCVHEFEAEAYRAEGHDVIVLPDSTRGNIARVRNWLIAWAHQHTEHRILLIDDDIKKIGAWFNHKKATALTGDRLSEEIEKCANIADQWGVALWGVNCVADKGGFMEYTPFNCRAYCSASFHGIDVSRLDDIRYDERLPLKEDYDICLQVINRDRKLLRFNHLHMMKDDHLNKGGCAMYRNLQREQQQMDLLIAKWGNKIVQRDKRSRELQDINPIMRVPIGGV